MSRWPDTWSCEEVRQQIEAFLDGELPAAATTQIRSHLDSCPACAAQVHLANEVQNELHALPELDTPAPVLQQILDQTTRTRRQESSRISWLDLWPRPAWAALAAAGLVLALGLGILTQRPADPVQPDQAAIAQATDEARYALARTGLLTRKAGLVIRDRTLRDEVAAPTRRGLSRVLGNRTLEPSEVSSEGVNDV